MPNQDKLEIIGPEGDIAFYSLDLDQGVTNIGRDPANDIVLDDAGIARFQAMVDHRQEPYQLTILSNVAETTLEGEPLGVSVPKALQKWANITIGDFTLILVEEVETTTTQHPAFITTSSAGSIIPATPPQVEAPALGFPPEQAPTSPIPSIPEADTFAPIGPLDRFTARPHDEEDEVIITELSENQWQVEVEQMSTCQLTIINGGDIVAAFKVGVQGLDPNWVAISHPYVNLFEGERATITLTLTPPHAPTSRAGAHHFAIIVTSSNYPGRMSRRGATLIINPYYEFAVEELSPKRQTISWFKRHGQITLPINNMGNSATPFRLEGADDERACNFEFDVPGERIPLATQAELRLYPEESIAVPIRVTPLSRRLIAFRKRSYPYTITTSLLEGPQSSRSMLGELSHRPLIGPWILLLALILFMVGFVFFFMPGPSPRLYETDQKHRVSATNNLVTLNHNVSRFKNINPNNILNMINAGFLDVTLERKIPGTDDSTYEIVKAALDAPSGATSDEPTENAVYRLTVENFLSKFLFSSLKRQTTWDITVVPQLPTVKLAADKTELELGQTAVLSWTQQYATRLVLKTIDGIPLDTIDSPEPDGTFPVQPESDTTYKLEAYNLYTENDPVEVATTIKVFVPPTPRPPTPGILYFYADPPEVLDGTPVTLQWQVEGTAEVSLGSDGPGEQEFAVPVEGNIRKQPTRSTLYTLKTNNAGSTAVAYATVVVNPQPTLTPTPSPTPVPGAPVISFFVADEDEIVKGDSTDVTLTWSIVGTTTNVELSSAELPNPLSNLQNEGTFQISLDDTALFVLTAFNGPAKASRTVQIEAKEPTPIPEPTATPRIPNITRFVYAPDRVNTCVPPLNIRLDWSIQGHTTLIQLLQNNNLLKTPVLKNVDSFTATLTENLDPEFTLTAENDTGPALSRTIKPNIEPLAQNDVITMTEDESPDIPVLDNDCDPPFLEGGPSFGRYDWFKIVSPPRLPVDPDPVVIGSPITYNPLGNLDYMAQGDTDTDSFTYQICDKDNKCDTATVAITITGVNDLPVAQNDSGNGYTTDEDTDFNTPNVLGNDSDPDGDMLNVSSIDTTNTKGLVSDKGDGTFDYDPNGKFESLGDNDSDTDTFSYTVDDGNSGTDDATVHITITGVNDLPIVTITQPSNGTIFPNGNNIQFQGTATDAEDGNLGSSLIWVSSLDGTIRTDDDSFKADLITGTHVISASVTDADGATGIATVTITVN